MTKVLVTVSISTDREVWTKRRADVEFNEEDLQTVASELAREISEFEWDTIEKAP